MLKYSMWFFLKGFIVINEFLFEFIHICVHISIVYIVYAQILIVYQVHFILKMLVNNI